jgi:hypothetical protein
MRAAVEETKATAAWREVTAAVQSDAGHARKMSSA